MENYEMSYECTESPQSSAAAAHKAAAGRTLTHMTRESATCFGKFAKCYLYLIQYIQTHTHTHQWHTEYILYTHTLWILINTLSYAPETERACTKVQQTHKTYVDCVYT